MTLDGLTLHICVDELNQLLADAKIQKIQMPSKEEVVLQIYAAGTGNIRLSISAAAGDCSLYLTGQQKANPKIPPAFCMFLRKYLTGARIKSVTQCGLDRVVHIALDSRDEMLHPVELTLIVEIMGKYSNIILVDRNNVILDSIKRVTPDLSSLRQVLPGVTYSNPPQQKYDPLTLSQVSMRELLQARQDVPLTTHMIRVFDGLSTQTAAEILSRADIAATLASEVSDKQAERIANVMHGFLQEAVTSPRPCVQHNADRLPVFFSAIPYETYPQETRMFFDSCNEMLDYYYDRRLEIFRLKQQKDSLNRTVGQILSKLNKRISIYEAGIRDFEKSGKVQQRADYITANLYQLKKGMSSFEAIDYETGEPVTVPLDVSLTPQELAQKLYKKIAKLKTAARLNKEKLEAALEEQDYLLGTMHFIEEATQTSDIADIRLSLQKAGFLPEPPKNKKTETPESAPLSFTSPTGYTILVGKNDRQNDILTMRTAARDDIWFHAQKIPGSHVLLQTNGVELDDIDDKTIVMAARLAARHSRARQAGKTPVDYTQRRNVKKPPASRPGKVIYDDYFTVYVDAVQPPRGVDHT